MGSLWSRPVTMSEQGLFSSDLLSPEVAAALPEGYKLRPLRPTDFDTGLLDCLRVLTTVGEISKEQFEERYAWLSRQEGGYYIVVIEDTNAGAGKVVGTGALIVERKL
jgi:glucosamine-phosphate N-acetyltransferase